MSGRQSNNDGTVRPYAISPAEKLLYATTRITAEYAGEWSFGTGFYYSIELADAGQALFLATNKHVVKGADAIMFELHESHEDYSLGPIGKVLTCRVEQPAGHIFDHPDPNVDLCFINLAPQVREITRRGQHLFSANLTRENIPTDDDWSGLDAIEEVLMVGCPNAIYDGHNHMPVARRGITASHPKLSYFGKNEFLIDMACFPGSSGSPVLLHQNAPRFDRKTGEYSFGQVRFALLGILYGGPQVKYRGEAMLRKESFPFIDNDQAIPVEVSAAMNLGLVIKSSAILELENDLLSRLSKL